MKCPKGECICKYYKQISEPFSSLEFIYVNYYWRTLDYSDANT